MGFQNFFLKKFMERNILDTLTELLDDDGPIKEELNNKHQEVLWMKSVLESGIDSIIVINRDSNVVLWNNACEKLFGYSKEEMIGNKLDCIMPKNLAKCHHLAIDRYLKTGKPSMIGKTRLTKAITKDDKTILIEISVSETPDKESFIGVIREHRDYPPLE